MTLRVIVCGGRNYNDRNHIHNTLCDIDAKRGPISCVIHGGVTGADHEAMIWAQMWAECGRKITHFPFAAPIRNARMLAEGKPDLVVAFPGGRGTADMVRQARAAGVEVIEVGEKTMKAIIDGKRYNTETATEIGRTCSDYGRNDFKWWEEALYKTSKGQYFLAGRGGPMTSWAESLGDGTSGGEGIRLFTEKRAREWAERYLKPEDVEAHFAVEEG